MFPLLNLQSEYIKIEYLLKILCRMTSDVKFVRVLHIRIIQKTISKHRPFYKCRETSTVEYIPL